MSLKWSLNWSLKWKSRFKQIERASKEFWDQAVERIAKPTGGLSSPASRISSWCAAHATKLRSLLPYAVAAVIVWMVVDLFVLHLRGEVFPEPPPPRPRVARRMPASAPRYDNLGVITSRNIFNSDGVIPPPISGQETFDPDRAVPTELPIQLLATIVHEVPTQSVALVRLKKDKRPATYRPGNFLGGLAKVAEIRRGRVYFWAKGTGRLEYAELPQSKGPRIRGELSSTAGISRDSDNGYSIERDVLSKHTEDIASVLQQAKAVPRIGPHGQFEGFEIEYVQEGSVFETLGIQAGDLIRSVNGQVIDSPAAAMALYNDLRDEGALDIEIEVERGGQSESFSYSVR